MTINYSKTVSFKISSYNLFPDLLATGGLAPFNLDPPGGRDLGSLMTNRLLPLMTPFSKDITLPVIWMGLRENL
jgi:hypothetical protein